MKKKSKTVTSTPKKDKFLYKGVRMKSSPEVKFATWLDEVAIPWEYESIKLDYALPGRRYCPDFWIADQIYVEVKGWLRPEDRTKMIAVRDQHPEVDIRFVFVDANKTLNKKSKTTYGMWATKHGFKWAEKTIPKEWLEEIL